MDLTTINKKNRRNSLDLGNMVFGKVPPQNKDMEEAVLGAILIEKSALDEVAGLLTPDCFYVEANQRIYRSMISLSVKNQPIDLLTVVEELKSKEELDLVGGPYYVSRLTNSVVSSANIQTHARIVKQKFIQRELIRISGEIIQDAYEDTTDVFDLQSKAELQISELANTNSESIDKLGAIQVPFLTRLEELRKQESHITGIPSRFKELDNVTHGWQDTDLIILAARPSVGKTAFSGNLAMSAAKYFKETAKTKKEMKSVAFFSLEMSKGQLNERIQSCETEIWLENIKSGKLSNDELKQVYLTAEYLDSIPLFIDDTAALNILQLRAKCRRLKSKNNLGMIIIDYLQLMSGVDNSRNSNREQEISRISRDLKGLAKELQVPIIALSQLSREVEKRKKGEQIPQLSDLRESGAIEQDADMVMFLYRPEYYDITANEMGESNKGETYVKIAKHRNGDLGTIKLKALLHIQKFIDDDGSSDFAPSIPGTNFRPVGKHYNEPEESNAKLYIKKGSKVNDFEDDTPF